MTENLTQKAKGLAWAGLAGLVTIGTGTGAGLLITDLLTNPYNEPEYKLAEGAIAAISGIVTLVGARLTYTTGRDALKPPQKNTGYEDINK